MIDPVALHVAEELRQAVARLGHPPETVWSGLIRQGLDEVIDGPRTGRWDLSSLDKNEKSYIGTKIEILVRSELRIPHGRALDLMVGDVEVDVKWSIAGNWMIGPENVDQICLGLGITQDEQRYFVGVFRASTEALTQGANRDAKRQLTAAARKSRVAWIVQDGSLPQPLLATMSPEIRERILGGSSAQDRVRVLAESFPGIPLSRDLIATVAGNKLDPMRRLRRDTYRKHPLGDMVLLHTSQGRRVLAALGYTELPKDHWIAVPASQVASVELDKHDD